MEGNVIRGNAPILVIGNSHAAAIKIAVKEQKNDSIEVVNLNESNADPKMKTKNITSDLLEKYSPEFVFSSFGGAEHNVLGLIEAPVKFDFVSPNNPSVETDRWTVPYGAVRATLEQSIKRARQNLAVLREVFSSRPVQHICSPPPFSSINEGAFLPKDYRARLQYGISPPALRKKLYDVHTSIFREITDSLGIGFIDYPPESVDEDGYLLPRYWTKDPTHGNHLYGALVVRQILDAARARQGA